jgi:hypothetical protein
MQHMAAPASFKTGSSARREARADSSRNRFIA